MASSRPPTETIRYLAVPVRASGPTPRGVFVVAADLSAERDDVMEAVQLATLVLITVLLIASALAWVVAGRLLAPLRALDETARSISETDLTRRIPVSGADEIAELWRTFNAMLDRLEGAFASQREFVSDASHELRTPITIVRGHLELLGDDPQERRETVALVTDELDRMSRFVDDLLLLAKAERSRLPARGRSRARRPHRRAAGQGRGARQARAGRSRRAATAVLHADRQRLTQAVMSLARTPSSTPRTATRSGSAPAWTPARPRSGCATSGPGVAREDQDRIFDRFARAAGSRRRRKAPASGSRSCAPSPTPTAAASTLASRARGRLRPSRSCSRRWHRRTPVEPHPDRRGRGAHRLVRREGPAGRRLHAPRSSRTGSAPSTTPRTRRLRPDDPRHRPARAWTASSVLRRSSQAGSTAARHRADRPRRGQRHGRRARGRRRRLHGQAVPLRGAARPRPGCGCATARRAARRRVLERRRRRARPAHPPGQRRAAARSSCRPGSSRSLETFLRNPGQVLSAASSCSPRLGLRLRPRLQRRRRLRRLPAPQARRARASRPCAGWATGSGSKRLRALRRARRRPAGERPW